MNAVAGIINGGIKFCVVEPKSGPEMGENGSGSGWNVRSGECVARRSRHPVNRSVCTPPQAVGEFDRSAAAIRFGVKAASEWSKISSSSFSTEPCPAGIAFIIGSKLLKS